MTWWLVLAFALLGGCVATTSAKIRRDTYLTAYMESQGSSLPVPGEVYGSPAADYGSPAADYGAPVTIGYNYGAPVEPHTLPENPFEPLHAKLILVFKVLLKLLIFKLIVKFLAIICVLFFLPKLSGLGLAKEASDDARKLRDKDDADKLQLTQYVLSAISGPPAVCQTYEDHPLCRLKRTIDQFDQQNSFSRLSEGDIRKYNAGCVVGFGGASRGEGVIKSVSGSGPSVARMLITDNDVITRASPIALVNNKDSSDNLWSKDCLEFTLKKKKKR